MFSRPVGDVFAFFADAYNLEQITPDFLRFRILRTSDRLVRPGTIIDYRLNLHCIPMRWRTRIEAWVPQEYFIDLQVRGPFRLWHHTHEFLPHHGGTLMRDRVRYQLPLGRPGRMLAAALVQRDLKRIFTFRGLRAAEIFAT